MSRELLSRWIKHTADIERLGGSLASEALEKFSLLRSSIEDELSKARTVASRKEYKALSAGASALAENFAGWLEKRISSHIDGAVRDECSWLSDFASSAGIGLLVPRNIKAQVLFSPYAGERAFSFPRDEALRRVKAAVDARLRTSYIMKGVLLSDASVLGGRLERAGGNLVLNLRTLNTAAHRITDRAVFRFSRVKVRAVTALDMGGCGSCGPLEWKLFSAESSPVFPLHENCRCSLIPDIPGLGSMTFPEFLDSLSEEDKRSVLGDSRYEMHRRGVHAGTFQPPAIAEGK